MDLDRPGVTCAWTDRHWDQILVAVDCVCDKDLACNQIVVVADHNRDFVPVRPRPERDVMEDRGVDGLAGARTTGAKTVSVALTYGDMVAFRDGDSLAERDQLTCVVDSSAYLRVVGVGGRFSRCTRPSARFGPGRSSTG
jgi:hypothetical protein